MMNNNFTEKLFEWHERRANAEVEDLVNRRVRSDVQIQSEITYLSCPQIQILNSPEAIIPSEEFNLVYPLTLFEPKQHHLDPIESRDNDIDFHHSQDKMPDKLYQNVCLQKKTSIDQFILDSPKPKNKSSPESWIPGSAKTLDSPMIKNPKHSTSFGFSEEKSIKKSPLFHLDCKISSCPNFSQNQQPNEFQQKNSSGGKPEKKNFSCSYDEARDVEKNAGYAVVESAIKRCTKSKKVLDLMKSKQKHRKSYAFMFYWFIYLEEHGQDIDAFYFEEECLKFDLRKTKKKWSDGYYDLLRNSIKIARISMQLFKQNKIQEAIRFIYTKGEPIENVEKKTIGKMKNCLKLFQPYLEQENSVW